MSNITIVEIINAYGPTEISIISHHTIPLGADSDITLGTPVPNVSCYILDTSMHIVPVGVVGEIYLGGIGVSPGYINLPELTRDRFVNDPYNSGSTLFKTGDIGRLLHDGRYEIIGRMDDQVKLKGYRIELDEVASAMMKHARVTSSAVIVKDNSHLVGFYTPKDISHDELRDIVSLHLPVYMVPAVFVGLDEMPTNVNGKTDKKLLKSYQVDIKVESPRTVSEIQMANIWSNVLNVAIDSIGRTSSFFSLGGDSFSAIRITSMCAENAI